MHRIGRTGRAGRSGRAISFVAGRELFQIQQIERFTRTKIHRAKVPTLNEVEEARATVFLDKLRATLRSGDYQKQDHHFERLPEGGLVQRTSFRHDSSLKIEDGPRASTIHAGTDFLEKTHAGGGPPRSKD